MKIQSTPSFKAKTTILSHNNILSDKQISRLKKMGESIGTNEDSIHFNVRNFKKNRIVVAYSAKLKTNKGDVERDFSLMTYKKLINPESFIEKIMTGIKNLVNKS